MRPWLALSIISVLVACTGLDAPASAPAEASREPNITALPTTSRNSEPKVIRPAPELKGLAEVSDILARNSIHWGAQDTRMAIARRGAVRLRVDGPDHGLADGAPLATHTQFAVIDNAERPRVVIDQGDIRLLLFVDRADAHPVILSRSRLAPSAGFEFRDPPQRGHGVLLPGTWVRELERKDRAVLVRLERDRPREGWIDAAALGTSFVGATVPASPDKDELSWMQARRRTKLAARPGGRALVTIQAEHTVRLLTERGNERAAGRYRLVEYSDPFDDEIAYVGFVSSRDLRHPVREVSSSGDSGWLLHKTHWGEAKSAPRVEVEAGKFLLDVEHSVVVGCVVKPAELADLGGGRYAVATLWGPIPVRLAPDSVDQRCGDAPKTKSLEP